MSIQKFVYCPNCGEILLGRYCVQCGFDTESVKGNQSAALGTCVEKDDASDAFLFTSESEETKSEVMKLIPEEPPSEKGEFILKNSPLEEKLVFAPKVLNRNKDKLQRTIQSVAIFFAVLSLLLMIAPIGRMENPLSSVSGGSIYRLAVSAECGSYVILMILSNTILFLTSLINENRNRFVSAIFGCVCEVLSLTGVCLMIAKLDKVEYFAVSAGVYVYLTVAILGLLSFFAFSIVCIVKMEQNKPKKKKSYEGIAKRNTKPKLNTKKKLLIGIGSVALLSVIGVSIFCGFYFSDIFRADKINKIEIGTDANDVKNILGKPDVKNSYEWIYYDSDYKKITEKLEHNYASKEYEQLKLDRSLMSYKRITINFYNGKVVKAEYDAQHIDIMSETEKPYKKVRLDPSKIKYGKKLNDDSVVASIFYVDGSFRKYTVPYNALQNVNTQLIGEYNVNWNDNWGDYYTTLKVSN